MSSQLVISNLEEDILASRLRTVRRRLEEIVQDLEERSLNRDLLVERVKEVERGLRQTRSSI